MSAVPEHPAWSLPPDRTPDRRADTITVADRWRRTIRTRRLRATPVACAATRMAVAGAIRLRRRGPGPETDR